MFVEQFQLLPQRNAHLVEHRLKVYPTVDFVTVVLCLAHPILWMEDLYAPTMKCAIGPFLQFLQLGLLFILYDKEVGTSKNTGKKYTNNAMMNLHPSRDVKVPYANKPTQHNSRTMVCRGSTTSHNGTDNCRRDV